MKNWQLAILVGGATAAAVTGVALAVDGSRDGERERRTATTMVAARDREPADAECPGDALREVMRDPELREELWALRDRQQHALRAWWEEYGDDPSSAEARRALQKVREEQRAALEELGEKYGVDLGGGALLGRGGLLGGELLGDALAPFSGLRRRSAS